MTGAYSLRGESCFSSRMNFRFLGRIALMLFANFVA